MSEETEEEKPLAMWVIYDNPRDFPGFFVARKHEIVNGGHGPTKEYWKATSLKLLRHHLQQVSPGLVCITRDPTDDLGIVESWI